MGLIAAQQCVLNGQVDFQSPGTLILQGPGTFVRNLTALQLPAGRRVVATEAAALSTLAISTNGGCVVFPRLSSEFTENHSEISLLAGRSKFCPAAK